MATKIQGLECLECDTEEVYMDVKEEPSIYKIGAYCHSCRHDYGVLKRVSRSNIDHVDEVYDTGEESIKELLE